MKAIVYKGKDQISLEEIELPRPKKGWALVKVSHVGICGTDLNIYAGTHPRAKAPLVMGHEFSGVLEQDTSQIPKGSRVTSYPLLSCGKCEACLTGNSHVCSTLGLLGIDCDGAMAEYIQVPIETLVRLGDGVSNELGALVEPIAVAVHALRESNFTSGDNAVVFGCGTIGLVTALTLRQFGASSVTMVETNPLRAELAKNLGFNVLDPTDTHFFDRVSKITYGTGFDWVFDCAGVQAVAGLLLDTVKVKGKIVIIAAYKYPASMPLIKGMFKEVSIQFVRVYRKKDFEIAALLAAKEPLYRKIITHVLDSKSCQEGFDLLLSGNSDAVKVMFAF
ncbi:zinc-dependent alcohol dehydrogenase [Pleomorphochaeta sp. DL1XJH-081]|uniref:zinc-dependent alcohol dehydrogenase n=1 Tax=Pleomorphochaeta sp. DL1XJH-081 TaxID=3409690 RepID=UPI003BB4D291